MSASWEFRRINTRATVRDGFGYVSDSEGRDILHVGERTLSEVENVAIGHLSAAAPDMLAALKRVLAVADRKTDEFDAARAAIAKAEGRA